MRAQTALQREKCILFFFFQKRAQQGWATPVPSLPIPLWSLQRNVWFKTPPELPREKKTHAKAPRHGHSLACMRCVSGNGCRHTPIRTVVQWAQGQGKTFSPEGGGGLFSKAACRDGGRIAAASQPNTIAHPGPGIPAGRHGWERPGREAGGRVVEAQGGLAAEIRLGWRQVPGTGGGVAWRGSNGAGCGAGGTTAQVQAPMATSHFGAMVGPGQPWADLVSRQSAVGGDNANKRNVHASPLCHAILSTIAHF